MDNIKYLFLLAFFISLDCAAFQSDPTRPSFQVETKKKVKQNKVEQLTGIFFKSGRYSAVINGNIYKVGDQFDGKKISKITKNYVIIDGPKGKRRLTLISKLRS